jgi:hypothetical protein
MAPSTNGKYITWPRVATAALVIIGGLLTLLWRGQAQTADRLADTVGRVVENQTEIIATQATQAETLEWVVRWVEGIESDVKALESD